MLRIETEYSKIPTDKWSAFVLSHPRGTVFQTPEMYQLYQATENNFPIVAAAFKENVLVGIMLGTVIAEGKGIKKFLTSRSIVQGGPLCIDDTPDYIKAIVSEYSRIAMTQGAIYTQIRNIFDSKDLKQSLEGFAYEPHYNLSLDLNCTEESLYDHLRKERKRNIRHAEAEGLTFKEISDYDGVSRISDIIAETYHRKHVPLSYADMFAKAQSILGDDVRFFGAYDGDRLIAGQVRLCYKDMVYAWFAGSDEMYLKKRPNDFLLWNVILWSKSHGYSVFDFGGGGKPGVPYGVRDYKLKYGCTMAEYGRFVQVHRKLLYKIGTIGYWLMQHLKIK